MGTWELHPGSVVLETKLGHGAFGDVYQGVVRRGAEEIDEGDGGVAIKVLKGERTVFNYRCVNFCTLTAPEHLKARAIK